MTYKEFDEVVTDMGFKVDAIHGNVYVWYCEVIVCKVNYYHAGIMSINEIALSACDELGVNIKDLLSYCYNLALTDIDNRVDDILYYYKIKPEYRDLFIEHEIYLNYNEITNETWINDRPSPCGWKTEFTDSECKVLEGKFNLDIMDRYQVNEEGMFDLLSPGVNYEI